MEPEAEITALLREVSEGHAPALEQLYERVYAELRIRAEAILPRASHTLQPTALVHESYLRVAQSSGLALEDRGHFFAVSARAMRQILVDHARAKQRLKRGGDAKRMPLEDSLRIDDAPIDLLELDDALDALAREDERLARVVELRFFAGLSVEETADVMGLGTATVKRDWRVARMWLLDALKD